MLLHHAAYLPVKRFGILRYDFAECLAHRGRVAQALDKFRIVMHKFRHFLRVFRFSFQIYDIFFSSGYLCTIL